MSAKMTIRVKRSAPHFNYNLALHVPSEAKPRDKEYARRALAHLARKLALRGFCPRFEKGDASWFIPPASNS